MHWLSEEFVSEDSIQTNVILQVIIEHFDLRLSCIVVFKVKNPPLKPGRILQIALLFQLILTYLVYM